MKPFDRNVGMEERRHLRHDSYSILTSDLITCVGFARQKVCLRSFLRFIKNGASSDWPRILLKLMWQVLVWSPLRETHDWPML